ncbi:MAG: hypothetical protein R3292_06770 [Alcanivorax sp.]|nr:hypothetical protein [Alcanivorax sp.]
MRQLTDRLAVVTTLLLLSSPALAGWYQVSNYTGHIGRQAAHLSLQYYHFGAGITVEGSYYYDHYHTPIALYGTRDPHGHLTLCEIHSHTEFSRVIETGLQNPIDTSHCPLQLQLGPRHADGRWHDGKHDLAVSLTRVGQLDNTGPPRLTGKVAIPFWGQTDHYSFIGRYRQQQGTLALQRLRVVNKASGKVIQELNPNGHDCGFGFYMTPIYMNVASGHNHDQEEVDLHCDSRRGDRIAAYTLDRSSQTFVFNPDLSMGLAERTP